MIKIVKEAGAEFVIDTTGAELFDALTDQPLLIKPNNHELAELYETSFSTIEDILPYGQKMLKDGAKNVIVSLGGDGALLFTGNEIYRSNVLKRPLKNSVGAGDSMIAGFIGRYAKTKDVVDAFKWGVACGSATAFSDDLAEASFIEELLPEVIIEQVNL